MLSYSVSGEQIGAPAPIAADGISTMSSRPGSSSEMVVAGVSVGGSQTPVTVIWDAAKRQVVGDLPGVKYPLASTAWSPDGRLLAGAQDVGDILVWDMTRPTLAPTHIPGDFNRFRKVAFAGNGRFAVVESSGLARVWRPGARTPVAQFEAGAGATSAASTPDGQVIAVGRDNGVVSLWSPSGTLLRTMTSGSSPVESLAFADAGATLLVGSDDDSVAAYSTSTGTQTARYIGHHGRVTSIAVTPDNSTMMTTSDDNTLILWDLSGSRSFAPTFAGSTGVGLGTLAMSRSGKIATIAGDGTIRFWDSASGTSTGSTHRAGKAGVIDAGWSPDGAHPRGRHGRRHRAAVGRRSARAVVDASRRTRHAGNFSQLQPGRLDHRRHALEARRLEGRVLQRAHPRAAGLARRRPRRRRLSDLEPGWSQRGDRLMGGGRSRHRRRGSAQDPDDLGSATSHKRGRRTAAG